MLLRLICAVLLLSSCTTTDRRQSPSLPPALMRAPDTLVLKATAIPRIVCLMSSDSEGQETSTGSGVWVGKNLALTADHVVAHAISCSIEGERAKIIHEDGRLDYALISAFNRGGVVAQFSCDGVVAGREYRATGYADGESYLRSSLWQALNGRVDDPNFVFNGLDRFNGLAVEGMSGGPVTEEDTGRVVAIVNAGVQIVPHDVWGRALSDTVLCGHHG